jgi:subtilisin-like proprotein convertase family protein
MFAATPLAPDWVTDFPSWPSGMSIRDSATDAIGNLVVIGRFSGTVDFDPNAAGTYNLTSSLSSDVFVAKYSPSGALLAAVDLGDIPLYSSENVAVDGSGNAYVAVEYSGQATLMNGQVVPAPGGYVGTIVAKLDDSLQNIAWSSIATLGPSGPYSGSVNTGDIAVDAAGTSVYFGGIMAGKGKFGTINLKVDFDGFVSRINGATGAFQSVKSLRGVGTIANVAVDPSDANAVYARTTANAVYDSRIMRLDGSGNTVWQKVIANNIGWSDMAARGGGLYLAGWFAGQASIDQTTLVSAGKSDALLVRLNTGTGSVNWAVRAGGAENDSAGRVVVDADGNLLLAGAFDGIAVFGADTLAESTSSDSYISQLDAATGAFLQSWRYGPARVVDLAAAGGHAYAVGAYNLPGSDFPDGSFLSTAEAPNYVLHFAAAADPTRPRINGFAASPDPVEQGDPLTLSVVGLFDPDVRVDSVAFYYDANGNRRMDAGTDVLVSVDANGGDGWSAVASTSGLPFGDHLFLAQATYDGGALSLAASSAPVLVRTASTYVSSDVGKQIRDLKTVVSTLTVPDSFTLADVDVTLSIRHTHNADLDVYLIHPDGTRVELFTDVGGIASTNDNMTNTTLDDQASISINGGTAPFIGSFRPEGLLSAVNGKNAAGVWKLEITDDDRRSTGTLDAWSLTISAAPPAAAAVVLAEPAALDAAVADIAAPSPARSYRPMLRPGFRPASVKIAETAAPLSSAAAVDALLSQWGSHSDEAAIMGGQFAAWNSLDDLPQW